MARRRARRSRRWGGARVRTLVIAAGAVIVVGAIVATWLVVDHNRDSARRAAAIAATSTTGVASPYDLTELPADADLDVIADASFVSILIPNDAGKVTSYGINAKLPGVQALAEAIMNAEEVSVATTATTTAGAAGAVSGSSIIFVMPSHETMTFSLDSAQGLVARGGKAWRPKGDLKALMKAATSAPK